MSKPSSSPLAGKNAIVTGASSGIGRACAVALAGAGVNLALVARRADALQALVDELTGTGVKLVAVPADVAIEEEAKRAAARAIEELGGVDLLINAAGIVRPGAVESADPADWRQSLEINLLAPMYLSQAVIPAMREGGAGHIVSISSNAAKLPGSAFHASYSASKYGVTAFSQALRQEVKADGIRVTVVEPGTTATDIAQSVPDPRLREQMHAHISKETSMQAEDVANAVLYALSQPARVNVEEVWLNPTF